MANIAETEQWEEGIYQLEQEDLVLGGPDGIDNLQAKQLANRTRFLKALIEALGTNKQPLDPELTAIAGLVSAANKLPYFTGAGAAALADLTAFARTLLDDADAAAARTTLGAAPLNSPSFTGAPAAPTPAAGNSTTQIATTAFVQGAIAALVNSSPAALDTLKELATALGNDPNFATTMTNALAGKQPLDAELTALAALASGANKLPYFTGVGAAALADLTAFARTLLDDADAAAARTTLGAAPLNSPSFTGTPVAPTPAAGNSTTQIATTAFVQAALSALASIQAATTSEIENSSAVEKFIRPDRLDSAFPRALGSSGYCKLPGGLILQWGIATTGAGGGVGTVLFPIAFPNECFQVVGTCLGSGGAADVVEIPTVSASSFGTASTIGGAGAALQFRYVAVGR